MTALDPTPIFDALVAELGPMYEQVETDRVVLESMAVMAMAERQP